MIVYDLHCEAGHRFEGWFGSSSDYETQREQGLVSCPECGAENIAKAPMSPAVPTKGNARAEIASATPNSDTQPVSNTPMPAEVQKAMEALAKAQANALKNSTNVGEKFAQQSREMHYGERDEAPIHGQASLEEAKSLIDEGVPIAALPFPIAPPEKLN